MAKMYVDGIDTIQNALHATEDGIADFVDDLLAAGGETKDGHYQCPDCLCPELWPITLHRYTLLDGSRRTSPQRIRRTDGEENRTIPEGERTKLNAYF